MKVNRTAKIMLIIFIMVIFAPRDGWSEFTITLDSRFIEFGLMDTGAFKELQDRGSYQNEITCRSDTGRTWYLTVHLYRPLRAGTNEIAPENLKWKITDIIGGNRAIVEMNKFSDFSNRPMVVYTSAPEDTAGQEVKIRLTFGLKIPSSQVIGNYQGTIRYTLTETLL